MMYVRFPFSPPYRYFLACFLLEVWFVFLSFSRQISKLLDDAFRIQLKSGKKGNGRRGMEDEIGSDPSTGTARRNVVLL